MRRTIADLPVKGNIKQIRPTIMHSIQWVIAILAGALLGSTMFAPFWIQIVFGATLAGAVSVFLGIFIHSALFKPDNLRSEAYLLERDKPPDAARTDEEKSPRLERVF